MKARLAAMTPEEKEVEFTRAESDSAARSAARYEQGRKAAEGGQLSGMDDVSAMKDFFAQKRRTWNKITEPIRTQSSRDIASFDKNPRPKYRGIDALSKLSKSEIDSLIKSRSQEEKFKFVYRDQGIDTDDPAAVQREHDRRSKISSKVINTLQGQKIARDDWSEIMAGRPAESGLKGSKASFGNQP